MANSIFFEDNTMSTVSYDSNPGKNKTMHIFIEYDVNK